MQFVLKLFPEITIKSAGVRRKMTRALARNLHALLRQDAPGTQIALHWDRIDVVPPRAAVDAVRELLFHTPGIVQFLEVEPVAHEGFDDLVERLARHYAPRVAGKRFRVRTKRSGRTDFSSMDFNRALGARLLALAPDARVDLDEAEVTVDIVLEGKKDGRLEAMQVVARHLGCGGFPLGEIGQVLALVSGGYDSGVAASRALRRGLLTHFCIFRLGGEVHLASVLPQIYSLWYRYGRSHRPQVIIVPFEAVADALKAHTDPRLMGVLLKRMMFRAAERLARRIGADALVTGESVGQVASQTLANLSAIESAIELMVLRPLITMHKQEIIQEAQALGLAALAACTPEYCGALIHHPHTAASRQAIIASEARFPWTVLDQALARAETLTADRIPARRPPVPDVPVVTQVEGEALVVDLRDPVEAAQDPIVPSAVNIPYTELESALTRLPRDRRLYLYCSRGVLSAAAAERLDELGFDVAILRPADARAAP